MNIKTINCSFNCNWGLISSSQQPNRDRLINKSYKLKYNITVDDVPLATIIPSRCYSLWITMFPFTILPSSPFHKKCVNRNTFFSIRGPQEWFSLKRGPRVYTSLKPRSRSCCNAKWYLKYFAIIFLNKNTLFAQRIRSKF